MSGLQTLTGSDVKPSLIKERGLILNTDVADSIQGHVGPNTKQIFETLTAVPFSQPKLKLAGYEFLLRDQFGNYYHKMRAVLFDGELYDVDQFIKPTMMMKHGGGSAHHEDKVAKGRLRITEGLLKNLREIAAVTFGRTNLEIIKARSLSQAPVAIETQDISHQANRLEDAIKAAKEAQGEVVKEETEAPDFKPLEATKAPEGEKLAQVITFPAIVGLTPKANAPKKQGQARRVPPPAR